ncbi:MAG TPA: hypothetical protein ENI99_01785 [Sedimenticola sp.]|nr:hypothetical protein [Sedimenticola sp.]
MAKIRIETINPVVLSPPNRGRYFITGIPIQWFRFGTGIVLLAFVALLGGCAKLGPAMMKAGRGAYNITIQATNDEQLLLNLVRLRYRDTPMFLEVSSVNTRFTLNSSLSASGSFPEGSDTYGIGGQLGYSDQPTVTYTPLQGENFVQRLLAPVDLDTVLLMYHSGWSIERVLRLAVQRLNGIENAPSASGPTPARAPRYRDFLRAAKLLRTLQRSDALRLGTVQEGDESFVAVQIAPHSLDHPEVQELMGILGLEPGRAFYEMRMAVNGGTGGRFIAVNTRSLLGTMFFLSQSVMVPKTDEELRRVTTTLDDNGRPFDWRRVTGGLFVVHSQKQQPANAAVSVYYRGHWFYIDDSDLDSKSTFSLLSQLFALQAGKTKSVAPLLTLPVGGG